MFTLKYLLEDLTDFGFSTFWPKFVVDSRHCFLILHERCDKCKTLIGHCSLVIVLASDGLSNVVMTGDPDTPRGLGTS